MSAVRVEYRIIRVETSGDEINKELSASASTYDVEELYHLVDAAKDAEGIIVRAQEDHGQLTLPSGEIVKSYTSIWQCSRTQSFVAAAVFLALENLPVFDVVRRKLCKQAPHLAAQICVESA